MVKFNGDMSDWNGFNLTASVFIFLIKATYILYLTDTFVKQTVMELSDSVIIE